MDDRNDILLLKQGDELAFERIYRNHWLKVYRFTGMFISDDAEREDILQAAFMRLWNMRAKLDENRPLGPLLFVITRNLVFNSKRNKVATISLEAALIQGIDDVVAGVEARDLERQFEEFVSMLPERQQEAFRLNRMAGLSYKEVAEKMGISEKGAERNISLAIKYIRKKMS